MSAKVLDWRELTPAEVLDGYPALTLTQVAYVLGLLFRRGEAKGQPNRRAALQLVYDGQLPLIDPTLSIGHWCVSSAKVRAYMENGPS